jgi:hypothetical protein
MQVHLSSAGSRPAALAPRRRAGAAAAPRPPAAAAGLPPRPRRAPLAVRAFKVSDDKNWHKVALKHVVEAQQFGRPAVDAIFAEAERMERVRPGTPESKVLEGRIMATLFYEPSTRTRLSFESAMARLGGTVLSTESAGEYSSAAKGETLEGACTARQRARAGSWAPGQAGGREEDSRIGGSAGGRPRPRQRPAPPASCGGPGPPPGPPEPLITRPGPPAPRCPPRPLQTPSGLSRTTRTASCCATSRRAPRCAPRARRACPSSTRATARGSTQRK